jgi:Mg-chelatase subunit ChlD
MIAYPLFFALTACLGLALDADNAYSNTEIEGSIWSPPIKLPPAAQDPGQMYPSKPINTDESDDTQNTTRYLKKKEKKKASKKSSKKSSKKRKCPESPSGAFILCQSADCLATTGLATGATLSAQMDLTTIFKELPIVVFSSSSAIEVRNLKALEASLPLHMVLRGSRISTLDTTKLSFHARRAQTTTVTANFVGLADISGGGQQKTFAHFTYVIDISGSTNARSCTNSSTGQTQTILSCEKIAVISFNDRVVDLGVAVDVGVVAFNSNGNALDLNLTEDGFQVLAPPEDPDIDSAINALTSGGGTVFKDALGDAIALVNQSYALNPQVSASYIIFVTDGLSDNENLDEEIGELNKMGTILYAFAVGDGSNCDGPIGDLADNTNGKCTPVSNATDLDDILQDIVFKELFLEAVDMTLNGLPLVISSDPNVTDHPLSANETPTMISANPAQLTFYASYDLCLEAKSGGASAGCCLQFQYIA